VGRPAKGGRKKRQWDIGATLAELDRELGPESDPGAADAKRSFLHFVRNYCRALDASREAVVAFDKLMLLISRQAGPALRHTRAIVDNYKRVESFIPVLDELLGRGERKDVWRLWFFSCVVPEKVHKHASMLQELLVASVNNIPPQLMVPGRVEIIARFAIISGFRQYGYGIDEITRLLDPVGSTENAAQARDRIRKETARVEAFLVAWTETQRAREGKRSTVVDGAASATSKLKRRSSRRD
jgi:hypothetical protein